MNWHVQLWGRTADCLAICLYMQEQQSSSISGFCSIRHVAAATQILTTESAPTRNYMLQFWMLLIWNRLKKNLDNQELDKLRIKIIGTVCTRTSSSLGKLAVDWRETSNAVMRSAAQSVPEPQTHAEIAEWVEFSSVIFWYFAMLAVVWHSWWCN